MKIHIQSPAAVLMSNPESEYNYFAWPTAVRLQNGEIAVAASGFRVAHVCPYGKTVLSVSRDNGETFSAPEAVIDTPLDDRDGGLCTFGESGLIVTSFNNSRDFQRNHSRIRNSEQLAKANAYLDSLPDDVEERYLGSTFRASFDCGKTFGQLYRAPVSSPHGPIALQDGTILYVGKLFDSGAFGPILCCRLDPKSGKSEILSGIAPIVANGEVLTPWEPYAFQTDSGRILCHIRAQENEGDCYFTLFQSESDDGGKTWTVPHQILSDRGGVPSHILRHSSGTLICAYSHRGPDDYSIRVSFSSDEGKTWKSEQTLSVGCSRDLGYPSCVELPDGSILTVFYAHETKDTPAVVQKLTWRMEAE